MTNEIKVTNIAGHTVFYKIPEKNIKRVFQAGETKKLSQEEIESVNFIDGGRYLIENYLRIESPEVLEELNIEPEPEYSWNKEDVVNVLLNEPIERLEDALNFAPAGIIDLIKDTAVELKIADVNKRNLITAKTGLNISSAIENAAPDVEVEEKKVIRKATPAKKAATTRKATTAKATVEDKPEEPVVE